MFPDRAEDTIQEKESLKIEKESESETLEVLILEPEEIKDTTTTETVTTRETKKIDTMGLETVIMIEDRITHAMTMDEITEEQGHRNSRWIQILD